MDEFYAKPAADLVAFTEGVTGLTIKDANLEVVQGRVVPKDIRVEFSSSVHKPQPVETFVPRVNWKQFLNAIVKSKQLLEQGDSVGAEAVTTELLNQNPHFANHPKITALLIRQVAVRLERNDFDGAVEVCDKMLKGFDGWSLRPEDELNDGTGLPDGQPLSLTLAQVLNDRADALSKLQRNDEALKGALSSAAWAGKTLSDPKSHLFSSDDRNDLTSLLQDSTKLAEQLLARQGRQDEAKILRQKADAILHK